MEYLLARSGPRAATSAEFANGETSPEIVQLLGGDVVTAARYFGGGFQIGTTTLAPNGVRVKDQSAIDAGAGQRDAVNIAALSNGGYVISWGQLEDGDFSIRYQVFGADGAPKGQIRKAFGDVDNFEASASDVIGLEGGGFVIIGERSGNTYVQTYRNTGAPRTESTTVDTRGQEPAIDVLGNGQLLAIGSSSSSGAILNADGTPTGDTIDFGFSIGTNIRAEALANGNTLVIGAQGRVNGQLYDQDLNPIGSMFSIGGGGVGRAFRADVSAMPDGGAIVTWSELGSGFSLPQARRIDADGQPVGPTITLGTASGGGEAEISGDIHVAALENGNIVFSWNQRVSDPGEATRSKALYQTFSTELKDGGIEGNNRANTLNGTGNGDVIVGFRGNDMLDGRGSDDALHGGLGRDTLKGGNGSDWMEGGADSDRLFGGRGADSLLGGNGKDTLRGDDGADFLVGGAGRDLLDGGKGNETLRGGTGDDTVSGGRGNDRLDGQEGDDVLQGGKGRDTIFSGAGSDTAFGGLGADTFVYLEDDQDLQIDDFDLAMDRIDISDLFFAFSPTAESYLSSRATVMDGTTIVDTGRGLITFVGVDDLDLLARQMDTGA